MCKHYSKIKHGNENIRSIKISNIKVQVQTVFITQNLNILLCIIIGFFLDVKTKSGIYIEFTLQKKKQTIIGSKFQIQTLH